MKKLLLISLVLLVTQHLFSQQYFYAMTSEGTDGGRGSIIKFSASDPTKPILVHDFKVPAPGNTPDKAELIELSDGQLWGTTGYGGKYNRGVLYSFNPKTKVYTVHHAFNGDDGSVVFPGVILATDGMLYGGTFRGGKGDSGVIYRFNPKTDEFSKLFDLGDYNIGGLTDRLMQHSNGKLYGNTYTSEKSGALFSYDIKTSEVTIEHLYENTSGGRPVGGLTEYKGILYGATRLGGTVNRGVLYSYNPSDKECKVIKHLTLASGSVGVGAMTLYNDKLYGLLSTGGDRNFGVLFEFDPISSAYEVKVSFSGIDTSLGTIPLASLHLTKDNKLIGTTSKGAKYRGGALFEFDPTTSTVKQIGAFNLANGYHPRGTPMKASDGKIYMAVPEGSINSLGAIVVQNKEEKNNPPTPLVSLNYSPGGGSPCGTLIQASDGMMYGLARFGGSYGLGVALQVNPKTDEVKVLDEFDWINGARPINDFTEYNGRLYCTTQIGGSEDRLGNDPGIGTISSLDMKTFKLRKEVRFDVVDRKAPNGGNPYGKLILAPNGKMYSTAFRGGKNDLGVIFEFDPNTRKIKPLFSFDATSGYRPIGSMALGENGWLYGMTQKGARNRKGSIYKYNYLTGDFNVIAPFGGRIDGRNAQSSLLYKDHKLYGLSFEGGQYRMGTIFSYDLDLDKFTKIANFNNKNGAFPYSGITMGPDGMLYTFGSYGGEYNDGTALRINPKTNEVEKLFDFNREIGAIPYFTHPSLYDPTLSNKQPDQKEDYLQVLPNPATDIIRLRGLSSNLSTIHIFDISGKRIKSMRPDGNKLNVSDLTPGLYNIEVISPDSKPNQKATFMIGR